MDQGVKTKRGRKPIYPKRTRLQEYYEAGGYTQTSLARAVGCSQSAISRATRNHNELSGDSWDKIADLLGVDPRILKGKGIAPLPEKKTCPKV